MDKLVEKIKNLGDPVLYVTGANREFISDNVFKLTGYYAEEIRINRDLFPGLINPEDYIETNFKIKNWHKNGEPGILKLSFRFSASNNRQVWIEDYIIGLVENDQKYMQGLMIEVTSQKEAETKALKEKTELNDNINLGQSSKEKRLSELDTILTQLEEDSKFRIKYATDLLEYSKENKIEFSKIKLDFLNAK